MRENGPTLTPALSLREGEGAPVRPVPSPPKGERVAFRAEPLAPSGEARAEMVRGRTKRGEEHHEPASPTESRIPASGGQVSATREPGVATVLASPVSVEATMVCPLSSPT